MATSIFQSALMLHLNSRLFLNALDGVTETQATERISGHNNPLNWLAAHTVWARYLLCNTLGVPAIKNPYEDMFEKFKPFDSAITYGTIAESKAAWEKVTTLLTDALASVSEEHLAAECSLKSPIGDVTNGGTIAFLTQHESYDIGQMAFLKKYFTKKAMTYQVL